MVIKSLSMRYIRRVDSGHHAWKVQIKRANVVWHKYFTDAQHGGKRRALAAAKVWRDELLPRISGPQYEVWKREQPRSNNTSGVGGVWRGVRRSSKGGRVWEWPYWQAFWRDLDGKRRCKTFSVGKYGERKAKALASLARREGLAGLAREAAQRDAEIE